MSETCDANQPPPSDDRRGFLTRLSLILSGLMGAVIALPGIGFMFGSVFKRDPRVWHQLGKVDSFEVGKTVNVEFKNASPREWAGVTAMTGAWLRRVSEDEFIAFSINCRHLGCPVNWVADASLFMCPCHGGVYYSDGEVAAGPPQQALARYPVRVKDGYVEIETSPVPLDTH